MRLQTRSVSTGCDSQHPPHLPRRNKPEHRGSETRRYLDFARRFAPEFTGPVASAKLRPVLEATSGSWRPTVATVSSTKAALNEGYICTPHQILSQTLCFCTLGRTHTAPQVAFAGTRRMDHVTVDRSRARSGSPVPDKQLERQSCKHIERTNEEL